MKLDDASVSEEQWHAIRQAANNALRDASAIGRFPTPVDDIMRAAKIEVMPIALDDGYIAKLERTAERAGKALLSALSKVLGIFDPAARIAFVDPETPKEKVPFLKLHESGHGILPWQSIFGLFEDCRKTLDLDIKQQFEREANVFASDVLFQLDNFSSEAADLPFGIDVPLRLSKRYGASIYSTARRYVTEHDLSCALLVLNPAELVKGVESFSSLRRVVTSKSFAGRFRHHTWPELYTPDNGLGRLIPFRKMSRARSFSMRDINGDLHEFIGEGFRTSHQTFILLRAVKPISHSVIASSPRPIA